MLNSRSLFALAFVTASLVASCDSPANRLPDPGTAAAHDEITSVQIAAALKTAVFDAMCVCQARLFSGPNDMINATAGTMMSSEDSFFASYVSEGRHAVCNSGSLAGAGGIPMITAAVNNHCLANVQPQVPNASSGNALKPGFCRANFNYCVGSELRLTTEAFTSTPAHAEIHASMTAEARRRFEASSDEYAFTIGFYQSICGRPTLVGATQEFFAHAAMCDALTTGAPIATVIAARLGDGVVQVQDLLEMEVRDRLAIADVLSPAGALSPSAYADALWGSNGARTQAAAAIMGDVGDNVVFARDSDMNPYDRIATNASVDLGYSVPFRPGSRAVDALALLEEYSIPVGLAERVPPWGTDGTDLERRFVATGTEDAFVRRTYNLLDHRIAASQVRAPYDVPCSDAACQAARRKLTTLAQLTWAEFAVYESASMTLPATQSPLQRVHRITTDDLRDGLALARARITTFGGRIVYRAAVLAKTSGTEADPHDWTQLAVRTTEMTQRYPLAFAAALAREHNFNLDSSGSMGAFPNFADATGPVMGWSSQIPFYFLEVTGGQYLYPNNWYGWEMGHLRRLGASGALHHLRVHLRRLTTDHAAFPSIRAGLRTALSAVEASVGQSWTEWTSVLSSECNAGTLSAKIWQPWGQLPTGGARENPLYPGSTPPKYIDPCVEARTTDRSMMTGSVRSHTVDWNLYMPTADASDYATGTAVLVATEEQARCLERVNSSTGQAECDTSNVIAVASSVARSAERNLAVHRVRATFVLPRDTTLPYIPLAIGTRGIEVGSDRFYVLWRTGSDAATYRYKTLDVVDRQERTAVHAFGGEFGAEFARIVGKDETNPGIPRSNSLGFATRFVPPLENQLTNNGNEVEDSWDTYLGYAETAATSAGSLVTAARADEIEMLREHGADQALLADALAAEQGVVSQACGGASGGNCDVPRAPATPLTALITVPELGTNPFPIPPGGTALTVPITETSCEQFLQRFETDPEGGFDFEGSYRHWDELLRTHFTIALNCTRFVTVKAIRDLQVHDLPQAVVDELARGGLGTFTELEGDVQVEHIRLFQSLKSLELSLSNVDNVTTLAISELDEAARTMGDLSSAKASWKCRLRRIGKWVGIAAALAASIASTVVTFGTGAAATVLIIVAVAGAVASGAAEGTSESAEGRCTEPNRREVLSIGEAAVDRAITSMDTIEEFQGTAESTIRQLALGSNALDSIARRADIAVARRALTETVIATNSLSDTPEWRALAGLGGVRAREALLRAQQHAFVARRAIELRVAESMPWMPQSEPFTAAPSTWANDVFLAHLASGSGPSWNGTSTVSTADVAITRYAEQLRDFVEGYTFARRVADGADTQVLNLLALTDSSIPTVDSTLFHQRWAYKCTDLQTTVSWATATTSPNGAPDAPCSLKHEVEYAEFLFPVRETDGYVHDRIASGSFNYRHKSFAINLVGNGIVDCSTAIRPDQCYRDGNLQVTLEQSGDVELENYAGATYPFLMERGVVLDARALNATRVLTNPLSSTDTFLIENFKRLEFWGRPFFGNYVLRIEGRREIQWKNLADVQLLLSYQYWTRQH